jgi:glutathione S-transferase
MQILNAQLGRTRFVAGDTFSMGDIPVGLIAYRYRRLVPERTGLGNLERWYLELEQRPAFAEHVLAIPFV